MSGIYINGMEMPKKGCIKMLVLLCDGKVIETTPGCQPQPEEQNYKAVPVPPHGRTIDADRLKDVFHRNVASGDAFDQLIDIAPTIIPAEESDMDTEEIVRCKDCEHWETSWTPRGVSDGRHYCAPLDLFPSADWFCADGEKREES